jgi:hypothetical protein
MAHPTQGLRTFKGIGSRLLRGEDNDWVNVQAREGTAGWKKGLLFLRLYAYQDGRGGNPGRHLYRYECYRLRGLEPISVAHGSTNDDARISLYEDLKRKGVMPASEDD